MSYRKQKLRLYNENPHCHWCGCLTILTNEAHIKMPDPKMATVDHLISRYDPRRWLHTAANEQRKVLACFECNQRRQKEETDQLSKEEILARSRGVLFKPNKSLPSPVRTLEQLQKLYAEQGFALDINNGQPKVVGVISSNGEPLS